MTPKGIAVPRIGEANMVGDARWAMDAARWIRAAADASRNDDAAKALKALIPTDAGACRVIGGGVEADRDERGAVRLRPTPEPIDMSRHNAWVEHASAWLETRGAVGEKEEAAKALKALLPAGKQAAFGYGVRVAVSKTGTVSLTAHAASATAAAA